MYIDTQFAGRIIQVTEALAYEDAVSNQVLALDLAFRSLGLKSEVYTKWHDQRHETRRMPIEQLVATERDVLIYHCYGHADHTPAVVLGSYCTRILLYHNITPHEFFAASPRFHEFCKKGREQLRSMLPQFHYFWGDSQYNVDELLSLGASPERSAVIPIIVPGQSTTRPSKPQKGAWIFVGRIAPNKNQLRLAELFADFRRDQPQLAQRLHIVGGYEDSDTYYQQLQALADQPQNRGAIVVHGKVSDEDRNRLLSEADIFVSMSEHEGFGVPLIESGLLGLPVAALAVTAVPETLGAGPGCARDHAELRRRIAAILTNDNARENVLNHQRQNVLKYSPAAVTGRLKQALTKVLPTSRQFRSVSVVICTYNRRDHLERVLDYLGEQSSGDFEVVVVDGPSEDGTKELLEQYQTKVKIGNNPERNLSKSRNIGLELASGDIVAFIDDDALPFDDWIESIIQEYGARPLTTVGLGGPAYYAGTFWFQAEDNGINRFAEAKVNIASSLIGKDGWYRYNTGTNATFRADVLRSAGGFDEQFDYYLDESEVCFRLQLQGGLIGYSPNIVVRHEFAQSHNRLGKLNYNWLTICKNTTYFIAAYSGLAGAALTKYIDERMSTERIAPIKAALAAGEINQRDHDRHVDAIKSGVKQGLSDSKHFPRRRRLASPASGLRPYNIRRSFQSFAAGRKRLHVCVVSKEFPPFAPGGGIGTLFYHLVSELLLMGHQISVVVPGRDANVFRQGRISVHFTPTREVAVTGAEAGFSNNISWSLSALDKVAAIHSVDSVDVIDSALWDFEALALALLPVGRRPPVVVRLVTPYAVACRINGWAPSEAAAKLFIGAEMALIENADAVVPISESIAASIEGAYNVARDVRWQAIPCGIAYWPFFDVNQGYDDFPAVAGFDPATVGGAKLVVFVGRLERRKGIDIVLEAAPALLRSDPTARLVIAGRDIEGWVQKFANYPKEDWHDRVHFLGEITDSVRDKLMAKAHILLFPSRYESFGLVPLEGFVHGVPAIAAIAGAIPEVVEDGVSGLLFEAEKPAALAQAAIRLLSDDKLHAQLSAGARARVRTLSSRRSAIATETLYHTLVRGRLQ
jgi:glycosyltransferase involved in cell wall biosynthesis